MSFADKDKDTKILHQRGYRGRNELGSLSTETVVKVGEYRVRYEAVTQQL